MKVLMFFLLEVSLYRLIRLEVFLRTNDEINKRARQSVSLFFILDGQILDRI